MWPSGSSCAILGGGQIAPNADASQIMTGMFKQEAPGKSIQRTTAAFPQKEEYLATKLVRSSWD